MYFLALFSSFFSLGGLVYVPWIDPYGKHGWFCSEAVILRWVYQPIEQQRVYERQETNAVAAIW